MVANISFSQGKERSSWSKREDGEKFPIVEVGKTPDILPNSWLEKIEKGDHVLKKPVQDDQTGQVLVTSPQAQKPKIILPLDLDEYGEGLKARVNQSLRWLAEWSRRLIKMLGYQVGFKTKQ